MTAEDARTSAAGQQHQARIAARRIREMAKGVTHDGQKIKDLMNEGRR